MWDEPFPNFSNCDLLIVNLQTLNDELYRKYSEKLLGEGRRYIFYLLMTGEKEVIVVLNSNEKLLNWLPIYPVLRKIAPANMGKYQVEPYLEDYIKNIENCNFFIHSINSEYSDYMVKNENYIFSDKISKSETVELISIQNQARQTIGGYFQYVLYGTLDFSFNLIRIHSTGNIIFLPPPTKIKPEQGIDLIINNLLGKELKESPPEWEKEIDLPGLKDIEHEISQKKKEVKKITTEIENLEKKKEEKILFRRLLWTKGPPLEDAVKEAFIFLGFKEIRKIRDRNLEDWVIEFKIVLDYQFGVLEVKGADKRTALSDLTQCNKWVEDYMLENKKVKGIFVPNQFRLENMEESRRKREHFEPNELEYAKTRDICILPAHEIFHAVVEKMKNNPEITREKIEQKIASAKGLCKLV